MRRVNIPATGLLARHFFGVACPPFFLWVIEICNGGIINSYVLKLML
jgi:hypothetical protein